MEQELFTPAEAVQYLREKRGIILTVASLRNRRRRNQDRAYRVLANNSLWTKEQLDNLKEFSHTKHVPPDGESSPCDAHGKLAVA